MFEDIKVKSFSVLIVVDVQNDFFSYLEKNRQINTNEYIDNLNRVINLFKNKNSIVIFSKDVHPLNHVSFKKWGIHCLKGSNGCQIVDSVNIDDNDFIVNKGTHVNVDNFSPFYDGDKQTYLLDLLIKNNIKNIYLAGLYGDFCIKETALDGIKNGFSIYLIKKLIFNYNKNFDLSKINKQISIIE